MSQNYFWFRTSSSVKNQCAPARQKFWIRLEKWGEISGTRFARPTFWLWKSRWVLFWCVYCTKLEPIFKTNDVARAKRVGLKLNRTLVSFRHCLASLGNPKKKKCSLLFGFARARFFLKMERTFFFLGFCPPSIRAVWRGFNSDSVLRKLFSGDFDFRKTETNFFGENSELDSARRKGSGEWMRAGFLFWIFCV